MANYSVGNLTELISKNKGNVVKREVKQVKRKRDLNGGPPQKRQNAGKLKANVVGKKFNAKNNKASAKIQKSDDESEESETEEILNEDEDFDSILKELDEESGDEGEASGDEEEDEASDDEDDENEASGDEEVEASGDEEVEDEASGDEEVEDEASGDEEGEASGDGEDQDEASDDEDSKLDNTGSQSDSEDKKEGTVNEKLEKQQREAEIAARRARTVFVGNLPVKVTGDKVKKFFHKYGKIESVRLRCAPVPDPRVSKKVAIIKKDFHPNRDSLHAYVRFANIEDALKSVEANGVLFENHHLRVNMGNSKSNFEEDKAIFVGNIGLDAEDDDLWNLFESCGEILSVRLVRHPVTMIGQGFGYVNFKSRDSVELALQMEEVKLKGRTLRVQRYKKTVPKDRKYKHWMPKDIHISYEKHNEGRKPKSFPFKNKTFLGKTVDKKGAGPRKTVKDKKFVKKTE